MKEKLRYVKVPNIIRNSESHKNITSKEILLSLFLLSNKFGGKSIITLALIEHMYNLTRYNTDSLIELVSKVHEKGLVNISNFKDIFKDKNNISRHTPLEVKETITDDPYTMIDLNLIDKIMNNKDLRFDMKSNLVYILLILQSRSGHRDFKSNKIGQKGFCYPTQKLIGVDTGLTRKTVNKCIKELEKLNLIIVIDYGKYTVLNRNGIKEVKDYNNTYIVKQLYYTSKHIEEIKKDSDKAIEKIKGKAEDDKIFSQFITQKSGDEYNKNRPISDDDYLELEAFEEEYFEEYFNDDPEEY